ALGGTYRTHVDYTRADVVLVLDGDPLGCGAASIAASRSFGASRDPEAGKMNRMWVVESGLSGTGIQADHRLTIRWAQVAALAASLEAALSKAVGQNATQPQPQAAFLGDPKVARFVAAL